MGPTGVTPKRILVIDDSPEVRTFMLTVLRQSGYEAVGAASGEEGLGFLARGGFDVVILDLVMPDTNGHDLVPRIRSTSPSTGMVVVSGYAGCLEQSRLSELGVDRVLTKPFKTERLLETLHRLSGRPEALRQLYEESPGYRFLSPRASV